MIITSSDLYQSSLAIFSNLLFIIFFIYSIFTALDKLKHSDIQKYLETSDGPSEQFWKSSESGRKSSENVWKHKIGLQNNFGNLQKIIKNIEFIRSINIKNKYMVACRSIWNFSSSIKLDISLIHCTHLWDIKFNTRGEIPYLCAPM